MLEHVNFANAGVQYGKNILKHWAWPSVPVEIFFAWFAQWAFHIRLFILLHAF